MIIISNLRVDSIHPFRVIYSKIYIFCCFSYPILTAGNSSKASNILLAVYCLLPYFLARSLTPKSIGAYYFALLTIDLHRIITRERNSTTGTPTDEVTEVPQVSNPINMAWHEAGDWNGEKQRSTRSCHDVNWQTKATPSNQCSASLKIWNKPCFHVDALNYWYSLRVWSDPQASPFHWSEIGRVGCLFASVLDSGGC